MGAAYCRVRGRAGGAPFHFGLVHIDRESESRHSLRSPETGCRHSHEALTGLIEALKREADARQENLIRVADTRNEALMGQIESLNRNFDVTAQAILCLSIWQTETTLTSVST